jgi:FkbM family methyltransferase
VTRPEATERTLAGRAVRRLRRVGIRVGITRPADTESLLLEADRLRRRLQVLRDALGRRADPASSLEEDTIPLDYGVTPLRIVASAYRRQATAAKEPFTVEWIEQSLREGGVLYDIGANVGGYTLIAAAQHPSVRIVAFEPAYKNYAALCDNIVVNEFADRVVPVPLVLGRETHLATFRHRRLIVGGAQHESRAVPGELDWEPEYEQPGLVAQLDDVVRLFGLPAATHAKVDVDGAELEVFGGAAATLAAQSLQGILVEMADDPDAVGRLLRDAGFELRQVHETPAVSYGVFEREG